jgi:hypothetical protein
MTKRTIKTFKQDIDKKKHLPVIFKLLIHNIMMKIIIGQKHL